MERIAVTGAAEFSGTASTKQLLATAFVFHTTVGGRSAGASFVFVQRRCLRT